jgi:hypothetical protein
MTFNFERATIVAAFSFVLLASQVAFAGPGYQVNGFIVAPSNGAKVLAATTKLQNAEIMKKNNGRLLLLANLADGADPATHSFVILFRSVAEYEEFSQKLQGDPAFTEFIDTLSQLGQGAGTLRFQTLRSWGDLSDDDVVWRNFVFNVTNPIAFAATVERFMQSELGKKFPGQLHLTSLVAGGITPVSNGIIAGYESQAEMEKWNESIATDPVWLAFLSELQLSSEFLGSNLSRTIEAWGKSMKSILDR